MRKSISIPVAALLSLVVVTLVLSASPSRDFLQGLNVVSLTLRERTGLAVDRVLDWQLDASAADPSAGADPHDASVARRTNTTPESGTGASVAHGSPGKDTSPHAATAGMSTEPAGSGARYRVQIGAFRDAGEARAAARRLMRVLKAELGGIAVVVTPAELSGKGRMYRLRTRQAIGRATAHELCTRLRAHSVHCFVARVQQG